MGPQRELTVDDYINILRRRWPIIVVLALLGCGLGVGAARYLSKRFTSETLVLVKPPSIRIGDDPIVITDTNQRLATMEQQILSRSRLEPVIEKLSLYRGELGQVSMNDLVERLRKSIEVTAVAPMARTTANGLPGFTISVTFSEAAKAQQICSTVTSMFLAENSAVRQHDSEQATEFIRSQMEAAKARLTDLDSQMAAFQRAHLGELVEDRELNLNVLAGLNTQLDAVTQALGRAQQDKTFAESSLAEQVANWKATLEGRNPETSGQQIAAMEAQLSALKSKYTDDHPDVIRLKRDIAAAKKAAEATSSLATTDKPISAQTEPAPIRSLRDQIRQYEQMIKDRTEQQEELHRRIRTFQARVESSPTVEQEAKALTRNYKSAQESFDDLNKKLEEAQRAQKLEDEQRGEQFTILEPANYPDKPSFPDPLKFTLGGLGGGIALGVGLSLLLEMRDTSVRSEKDIEALLHLPVLAVVPVLKKPAAGKANLSLEPAGRS
jgi:polysaccharide chain length determinant protein (PEP-CTERM system associated)